MVCQGGSTRCPGEDRLEKGLGSGQLAWGLGQFGLLPEWGPRAVPGRPGDFICISGPLLGQAWGKKQEGDKRTWRRPLRRLCNLPGQGWWRPEWGNGSEDTITQGFRRAPQSTCPQAGQHHMPPHWGVGTSAPPPSNQSPTLCSVFLFTLAQVALGCRLKNLRCVGRQRIKPIQGSVGWLWHMCALPTGAFAFLRAFWSSILQFLMYLVSPLAVVS